MRNKISIIGAGRVGSTAALWAVLKELGDVVLVDIQEGLPQGIALDIMEASPIEGFDSRVVGTNSYEVTEGTDVAIITAGLARKPGMTRDDLLAKNTQIVKSVTQQIVEYSPKACIIVVTNPLDAMAYVAKRVSGFPKNRVMGMAGVLDSARLRYFIAEELGVPVKDTSAFVLGGHGDSMVPLPGYSKVKGRPITELLSKEKIDAIVERTRKAGAEIIGLMKTSSAYYSPSASVIQMAKAILKDEKKILPCSAYLEGEYGVRGYYVGVPVELGREGVEKVIEMELSEEEKGQFQASMDEVKKLIEKVEI